MKTLAIVVAILIVIIVCAVALFFAYRFYRNRFRKDTENLAEIIIESGEKFVGKDRSVGLVIGVIRDDAIFIEGFGKTSKERDEIPDGKTLFELASIVKTFTTSATQILVDRGEISWDDPLDMYFDRICDEGKAITLRHLATHTSGLPRLPTSFFHKMKDALSPYKHLTKQDLYDYLETCDEISQTGTYAYSNLGMGLLGHILELKTGKSYESIIKDEFASKLDMSNTTISLSDEQRTILAQGYNEAGDPNPLWEKSVLEGSGSFLSNAEDMIKFINANFEANRSEVSGSLIRTQERQRGRNTGLGWHYYSRFLSFFTGEDDVIWHNGATGGYSSFIAINRSAKCGVIILSNSRNDVTTFGMRLNMLARNISFSNNYANSDYSPSDL